MAENKIVARPLSPHLQIYKPMFTMMMSITHRLTGVARIGRKAVNPTWTPPAEMIERTPKYARWADGMPGGIPENPLGKRALYLFTGKGDTGFRIHGTNSPGSIGTAASSGCIRMLNHEVIELYNSTPRGTKVIVI